MQRQESTYEAKKHKIHVPPAGLRNNAFAIQFTTKGMYPEPTKPVGTVENHGFDNINNTEEGYNS